MLKSRAAALAGFAALTLAFGLGAASATPGANITGPILAHVTVAGDFSVTVPAVLVTKKKVRVKMKNGKFRTKVVTVRTPYNKAVITCVSAVGCDLVVQQVTIGPGGTSGWHSHPGSTLVSIVSGEGVEYHAVGTSCFNHKYGAGSGFTQTPTDVHVLRNEGTAPLVAYATYILPKDTANTAIRVDQPAPTACPNIN
jgi:quercetin dioxygenase-like cupin family protein